MPQPCRTCNHPERDKIESAILNGESIPRVASAFGVSDDSIRRHLNSGHLRDRIAAAPPVAGHIDIDGIMGIYGKQLLRIQALAAELDSDGTGAVEPKDRISVQRELRQTIDSIVKAVPLQRAAEAPEQVNNALDARLDAALERLYGHETARGHAGGTTGRADDNAAETGTYPVPAAITAGASQ